MAINPLSDRYRDFINNTNSDIVVNKGGAISVRELDNETKEYIFQSQKALDLVPDHPGLNLRDLRITFRNYQNSEYAEVRDRHTNEILITIPREEFYRKMGKYDTELDQSFTVIG